MKRVLLALTLAASFVASAQAADYKIDGSHTQVLFSYSHFGMSHITGRFDEVKGSFDFDAKNPAKSSIQVEIPIASLSTGVAKLDEHMKSPDFFDAAKFPTATFKSTKVTAAGDKKLSVAGDLTIHGVTKPVVLDVTINGNGPHPMKKVAAAGFDARTTIKRSEFGIEKYAPAVSDDITIAITLEATAAADAAAPAKK
jgi:polyisoprenoid-binding protein YceI